MRVLPHLERREAASDLGRRQTGSTRVDRTGAFTLIELMVVLILMAILAAAVIPVMKGTYQNELLRSTGRDLTGAIEIAYSEAVTEQTRHRLVLDAATQRFQVERYDPKEERSFQPARHAAGSQGRLDRRIQFEVRDVEIESDEEQAEPMRVGEERRQTAQSAIEFYPDGTAEAKEIVLRDQEQHGLALRINPATTRVTVVDLGRSGK